MPLSETSIVSEWSSEGTGGNPDRAAGRNRVARIQQQIGEHLLEFAAVAEDLRRIGIVAAHDFNLVAAQLRLKQLQGVVEYAADVEFGKLGGVAGARKIQQVIDDVGRALSLTANFQQKRMLGIGLRQHAEQHLRVRRNAGQRRVHFVGHAGGQQAD